MILVDTSVLLDVLGNDAIWADWSQSALESAAATDNLAINDIVYAELSSQFATIEKLDAAIATIGLTHAALPRAALFLAAKAFLLYRSRRGARTGVLSDFFIGAHAAVEGCRLVTRDTRHVSSYFPDVSLIAPRT